MPTATFVVELEQVTIDTVDEDDNPVQVVVSGKPKLPPMISDDGEPQIVYDTGRTKEVIHNIDTYETEEVTDPDTGETTMVRRLVRTFERVVVPVMAGGICACSRKVDNEFTQIWMVKAEDSVLDGIGVFIEDIAESEEEA